jgi:aspartyl aminopeptidase
MLTPDSKEGSFKLMPEEQPTTASPKADSLFFQAKSAWEQQSALEMEEQAQYLAGYSAFMRRAKTERECVKRILAELEKAGYSPLAGHETLKSGAKVYKVIKHRAVLAAHLTDPRQPWRVVGAHIDSPRLDLKPNPLFEDSSLALLQSHYYGGIKKYQWVNQPLAMYGVIQTSRGRIDLAIGDQPGEPVFIIPDIAPHIAKEQMNKLTKEAVAGEQLRILVGNQPLAETQEKEKVKAAVLRWLAEKHQIQEKDFFSADITFVPAGGPYEVGFDRSMLAAYGQDDRACAYALLAALVAPPAPKGVGLGLFMDKEEIGSFGNTGAQSQALNAFASEILTKSGCQLPLYAVWENATALSGDVTEAINPNFKDASDTQNSSYLGRGVAIEKYGGGGGKYETNEASHEYMSTLLTYLESQGVRWQTGEMGRIDLGGGGTIAMYLANLGMDVIDCGPPLLSMHSPCEIASKVDLYQTYRAYRAFLGW